MIKEICIEKNTIIRDAIKKMDEAAKKILIVIEDEKVIGTITDGDIRRWILTSGDFSKTVTEIMNRNPICIENSDRYSAKRIMKEKQIDAIPVINNDGKLIDVAFWNDSFHENLKLYKDTDIPVVIMAGGKGTRLYPYTKILPKPLIPIGDLSISERIIERFVKYGCKNFFFTVNYKKNMIRAYFDELDKNYEINYVEEERFLGTAGSLYLLKDKIKQTFFVSNCDVLIEADYMDILNYHKKEKNKITMVTSLKNYKIPYGVIKLNDRGCVVETVEKPEFDYLVNAGFYILEPEVLNDIPHNTFFHITDLINDYLSKGKKVGTYPVTENSWLDMGEFKEMSRMVDKLNLGD